MKKIEKYIKSNKGSITTVVLVTVLFFITILSTAYIVTATLRKSQLKSEVTAKEVYEHDFNNIDTIIEDLRNASYDPASEGVTIPTGFYYVGGTKDTGLVISDNSADENKYQGQTIVGTDLQGNQFVWVPVASIADYKRTAYSINVATGTTDSATNSEQIKYSSSYDYYFKEAMPEDEKISVETYHGFYIGRYEAGDAESTNSKTMRESGASTINTITLKKGQAPYNYVTKTQAQSLAEGMKAKQGYSAKTKLCSSYAWDTAIAFIQKSNNDYGNSSKAGNYYDVPDFSYVDIKEASQTKSHNSSFLIPTGQTTPVCNIYDMGGNCCEWTTERYSLSSYPCTLRGGSYGSYYADHPAGDRNRDSGFANGHNSFRPTLFM